MATPAVENSLAATFAQVLRRKDGLQIFLSMQKRAPRSVFKRELRSAAADVSECQIDAVCEHFAFADGLMDVQRFLEAAFMARIERLRARMQAAGRDEIGGKFDVGDNMNQQDFYKLIRRRLRLPTSEISDRDVQDVFRFIDADRSGSIDSADLTAFVEAVGLAQSDVSVTLQVALYLRNHMAKTQFRQVDVFHRMDTDGSGDLDAAELGRALEEMGCPVSGTELEMLIAAIDVDCGGTVTIDEFLDFLKKARPKDHKRRVRPLKKWMPHERWGGLPPRIGSDPPLPRKDVHKRAQDYAASLKPKGKPSSSASRGRGSFPFRNLRHHGEAAVTARVRVGESPYKSALHHSVIARRPKSARPAAAGARQRPMSARPAQIASSSGRAHTPTTPEEGTTGARSSPRAQRTRPASAHATVGSRTPWPPSAGSKASPAPPSSHDVRRLIKELHTINMANLSQGLASSGLARAAALESLDSFAAEELITASEHKQIAQLYGPSSERFPGRGVQASNGFVQSWLGNRQRQVELMRVAKMDLSSELAELRWRESSAVTVASGSAASRTLHSDMTIASTSPRLSLRSAEPRGLVLHGIRGGRCGPGLPGAQEKRDMGPSSGRQTSDDYRQQQQRVVSPYPGTSPGSATLPLG